MTKKYYKVVNMGLKSFWVRDTRVQTQYKIGEFVSSPIEGSPLAVFDTLEHAKEFVLGLPSDNAYIYECEIKNKYKNTWLPGNYRDMNDTSYDRLLKILKYIKNRRKYTYLVPNLNLPDGSITCKQVKLIKRVYEDNRGYWY
jgi:hypothetical protein